MKTFLPRVAACLTGLATCLIGAEEEKSSPLTGTITLKAHAFDFTQGYGSSRTSYLEQYYARKGWGETTRGGFFLDVDWQLKYELDDYNVVTFDRWGEGRYREGGRLAWDKEQFQLSAKYDFIRTATGGLGYMFSPAVVQGSVNPAHYFPARTNTASGYLAQFNDETNRKIFYVDRLTYGAGFEIKPGVLGELTRVSLDWNGYTRKGQKMQSTVYGGSDLLPTTDRALQRWRALSKEIDEMSNQLTLKLQASPGRVVNLTYLGTWDHFNNRAPDLTISSFNLPAPYFVDNANPLRPLRPLGFTPDSTLISHALRATKDMGNTRWSAGAGMADLEQDSFTRPQIALGYETGKVKTRDAFLNFDTAFNRTYRLQGHVRYGSRENASTFPVPGLITDLSRSSLGVRLNETESVRYGLAAILRPKNARTTITTGWQAEDKTRDLTYNAAGGIIPSVSLLKGDTSSDELFVRTNTRLSDQLALRGSLAYTWADKTGFVTEPARDLALKTALVYTTANGDTFSFYYNLKDNRNDNNSFTDKAVVDPKTYYQNIEQTFHSGGLSYDFKPSEAVHTHLSLNWSRQDASVLYYETSRRRYEATTVFNLRDLTSSSVDVYILSMGWVWKYTPQLHFDAAYDLVVTDGNLASGEVARELSKIDDTLDSSHHTLAVGATYHFSAARSVRVGYTLEDYSDSAYPLLSGRVHQVLVGLNFHL